MKVGVIMYYIYVDALYFSVLTRKARKTATRIVTPPRDSHLGAPL